MFDNWNINTWLLLGPNLWMAYKVAIDVLDRFTKSKTIKRASEKVNGPAQ